MKTTVDRTISNGIEKQTVEDFSSLEEAHKDFHQFKEQITYEEAIVLPHGTQFLHLIEYRDNEHYNDLYFINPEAHLTTIYILQDEKKKELYAVSYRPTENFKHHKTSINDAWTLECGTFLDNPSHSFWINDIVSCHINTMGSGGISTQKNVKLKVVAKAKYIWDYSLPEGKRKLDNKESRDFQRAFSFYLDQNKKKL